MSTADSQLLVSASAISYDISDNKSNRNSLLYSRLTVVIMCVISMLIALYAPDDIFSRVLFAWNALGAAFGPLLIVKVISSSVNGKHAFAAIFVGFFLSVILSLFPSPPGDYLERIIPFVLAFAIAWHGRTSSNEDQAA
jgi:Na+/proline symporter